MPEATLLRTKHLVSLIKSCGRHLAFHPPLPPTLPSGKYTEKHLANLHTHTFTRAAGKKSSSWTNAPNRSNQQQWTGVTEGIFMALYLPHVPDSSRIIPAHYLPLKRQQPVWSLSDDLSQVTMEFSQPGFSSGATIEHERQRGTRWGPHTSACWELPVRSLGDLARASDSKKAQQSEGSCLVMVRKLIKWREVMGIGFKPLATFLLR